MKNLMLILLAAVFTIAATSQAQAGKEKKTTKEEVTLSVNMNCQACADKVTKQLAFTKGVKAVEADFEKDVVKIVYDTRKTSPEKLIASLKEIDYEASVAKAGCCKGAQNSGCAGKQTSTDGKPAGCSGNHSGCAGKQTSTDGKPAGCAGQHKEGEAKPAGCAGHK